MAETKVKHPSVEERASKGKGYREKTPVSSHTGWVPAPDRPDPVALLEEQNLTREQDLVPVRHGRMLVSPFTFYRGAAKIMAADLKDTPRAGLVSQLCGDAHLSNFGVFASPERNLLFDLNDFDETLPGPFEYDVKRMAASFTIAARNNAFTKEQTRDATLTAVRAYREAMAQFAQMRTLDIWYARLSEEQLMEAIDLAVATQKGKALKKAAQGMEKTARQNVAKAHTRDSLQALSKLAELVDGKYRIVSQPPIVIPARELGRYRTACLAMRLSTRFVSSSGPTGPRCRMTGVTCSSASKSSTSPARSWASAVSARGRSSPCSRAAINRIPCSSRSRRPRDRCSRTTCRRASSSSRASAWCRGSG